MSVFARHIAPMGFDKWTPFHCQWLPFVIKQVETAALHFSSGPFQIRKEDYYPLRLAVQRDWRTVAMQCSNGLERIVRQPFTVKAETLWQV